jgi:hypothetical protein
LIRRRQARYAVFIHLLTHFLFFALENSEMVLQPLHPP